MVSRLTLTGLLMLVCSVAHADEGRTLLYLSDAGPLVIQLRVTIDGESPRAVWSKFVDKLFTDLDRDGSGALEGREVDSVPSQRQWLRSGLPIAGGRSAPASTADSSPRDGRVSKDELADYLDRIIGDSLAVTFTSPSRREDLRAAATSSSGSSGDERLMELLDGDDDGMLAADEFVLSGEMRKLDLDDDGTISRGELAPLRSPYLPIRPTTRSSGNNEAPIIDLGGDQSSLRLARRILQRYDGEDKDGRLSLAELGGGEQWFSDFDLDGNGQLDLDELRQLLRGRSPQVLVSIRLGRRKPDQRAVDVELKPSAKIVVDAVRHGGATNTVLAMAKTQLEFDTPGGVSTRTTKAVFEQQFSRSDRDNNGYLDREEVDSNPMLREAFDQLDADDDEKVFKEEFVSYFERIAAAARARTLVSVSNQGNRLFDILDVGRDGRLSPRELLAGRKKIAAWDEDGDEMVAAGEIPQTWRFSIARGAPRFGGVGVVRSSPSSSTATRQATGPTWFTQMDRNRDGELSRREFLGPLPDFARLDADENGAIDSQEALAAK